MNPLHHPRPVVATLLLAVLALTSLLAQAHGHETLDLAGGHGQETSFAAGHSHPVDTLHIEAAIRVERPVCSICILRQSQDPLFSKGTALTPVEPGVETLANDRQSLPSAASYRLPATRAPPHA